MNVDEARLLPHLRVQKPYLIVQPDNGVNHQPTFNPQAPPSPGELRGIPVVGRGVGGVQPGTQPENATVAKLMRDVA